MTYAPAPTTTPSTPRSGSPRHRGRRGFTSVLALGIGVLALLGPAAGAAELARSLPTADEPVVTFGLQPTQAKDQPFRPNFTFDLAPGQEVQDKFRVRNAGSTTLKFTLFASDAFNADTGAIDLLPTGEKSDGIGQWVTLDKTELELAGNEFVDIPFTLKVPNGALPGDHTAGIVASLTSADSDGSGPAVAVDRRIGTRVLVRVAGALVPKLVVSDLKTSFDGPMFPFGRGAGTVSYRVSNNGNVRMGADQKIKISSPIGFPAASISPAAIPELLPGNSITQTHTVKGVWPTFLSSTKVTLTPTSERGDSFPPDLTASSKKTMWTIPWAFLVFLVVVAAGFVAWKRRQQQVEAQKANELNAMLDARLGASVGGGAEPTAGTEGTERTGL